MKHTFIQGEKDKPTFILLHGTGGDENSLLEIAQLIDPKASYLGIKGNILENGMPRYFKRLSEGNYDLDDLKKQGDILDENILIFSKTYEFDLQKSVLLGYSNGANIAMYLLLSKSTSYPYAMLFNPMYPVKDNFTEDLNNTNIFLSMGKKDPIVPINESLLVIDTLKKQGANLDETWTLGHNITMDSINLAKSWYKKENI